MAKELSKEASTRIDWWAARLVQESADAKSAFSAGSTQLALVHIASMVEALADILGELDRKAEESEALDLRNQLFNMSETWDESQEESE